MVSVKLEPAGNVVAAGLLTTNVNSAGVPPLGGLMVCVVEPIGPVALLASVTCSVRLPPPPPARRSHSGIAMLPAGTAKAACNGGARVQVSDVPALTVSKPSAADPGSRDSCSAGVRRR